MTTDETLTDTWGDQHPVALVLTIWTGDASEPHSVSLSRKLQGDEEHLIAEAIECGKTRGTISVVSDDPALSWEV